MGGYINDNREKEARLKLDFDAMVAQGRFPYPSPKDILVGNSRQYHGYSGNLEMNQHVQQMAEDYGMTEDQLDKTILSMLLVKTLQEEGRRFLQRTEDHWIVVDDQVAARKVAQAVRTWRKKATDESVFV